MSLTGSITSLITVTVIAAVAASAPAQRQDAPGCTPACVPGANGATPACCSSPVTRWTGAPTRSLAASAPCPACGTVVGDGGGTASYNGFDIGVCGSVCDRRFKGMSTRDKDAFIGRFVESVTDGCPLSAGCPVAADSPFVTHEGTLFQVCCQTCLDWWEKADDETRTRAMSSPRRSSPSSRASASRPIGGTRASSRSCCALGCSRWSRLRRLPRKRCRERVGS